MRVEPYNIYVFSDVWKQVNGIVSLYRAFFDEVMNSDTHIRVIWIYPDTQSSLIEKGSVVFAGHRPFFFFKVPKYPEIQTGLPRPGFLSSLIRKYGLPSVVHVTTPGPFGIAGRWMAKRYQVPSTGFYHTFFPQYLQYYFEATFGNKLGLGNAYMKLGRFIGRMMDQIIFGACDILFCHTSKIRDHLERYMTGSQKIIASQFLDTKRFPVTEGRTLVCQPNELNIGYVGRLAVEKSLEQILDIPNGKVKMHVVGDGPLFGPLIRRYPQAIFHGYKEGEELRALYKRFDFLVLPSVTDTLGLVVLEAAACGVPSVVRQDSATADLLKAYESGVIVESFNNSDWIERLLHIRSSSEYHRLVDKSRMMAESQSVDIGAERLISTWLKMIHSKGHATCHKRISG